MASKGRKRSADDLDTNQVSKKGKGYFPDPWKAPWKLLVGLAKLKGKAHRSKLIQEMIDLEFDDVQDKFQRSLLLLDNKGLLELVGDKFTLTSEGKAAAAIAL